MANGNDAPTWAQISALFNQTDVAHMKTQGIDLTSCAQVSAAAQTILGVLQGNPVLMPPASSGGPWPQSQIDMFQAWVNAGAQCPSSASGESLEDDGDVEDGEDGEDAEDDDVAGPPTWPQIAALFNATDIAHMKAQGIDLTSYEQVSQASQTIYGTLNGNPFLMPPKSAGGPWPPSQIATFKAWMDAGCPQGS